MRALMICLLAVPLWACGSSDRPRSNVRTPSCTAPICNATCACDLTFMCDEGCSDCDPECGSCRTAEGNCRSPVVDAGTGPGVDAGPSSADAGMVDAGPCEFPPAQSLGAPCCPGLGLDACSLDLFCDAYDGRTQPVCYGLGSRENQETCHEDAHCASNRCADGVCRGGQGDSCTGPGQCEPPRICHPVERVCLQDPQFPCNPATHEGCASNETCLVGGGGTSCATAGTRALGDSCMSVVDCQPKLVCLGGVELGFCTATCDPESATPMCPPGQECREIPIFPGAFGFCQSPA